MTTESGAYQYDVFISYSHYDRVWVQETLLPQLEQAGLRVCIDYRDFAIGTPTLINIEQTVDTSHHTLIVLTPAWVESEWTQLESLLVGTADPPAGSTPQEYHSAALASDGSPTVRRWSTHHSTAPLFRT
jgi:TIR domain